MTSLITSNELSAAESRRPHVLTPISTLGIGPSKDVITVKEQLWDEGGAGWDEVIQTPLCDTAKPGEIEVLQVWETTSGHEGPEWVVCISSLYKQPAKRSCQQIHSGLLHPLISLSGILVVCIHGHSWGVVLLEASTPHCLYTAVNGNLI